MFRLMNLVNGDSLVGLALQELAIENTIANELEQQGIKLNNPYSLILLRLGQNSSENGNG